MIIIGATLTFIAVTYIFIFVIYITTVLCSDAVIYNLKDTTLKAWVLFGVSLAYVEIFVKNGDL